MKKLLFILLISTAASAQSDTSKMLIRVSLMQKHIAYMGAMLQDANTLKDARLHDTLSARIGSGSAAQRDSVIISSYPAGYILKFFQRLGDEQALGCFDMLRELVNGKTGFNSIPNQLQALGTPGAIWLRRELVELKARKEAVINERLKAGADWLKTPIE